MSNRSKRVSELNELDSLNAEYCEMLTSSYTLREFFPDHPYLVNIFENYRSKKLDELTLFWCFIISFMHWSSESKMYDPAKKEYTNLKFYGILRGQSVSHKSGYIKPIREAFDFVERYFREMFVDAKNQFSSTCIESLTAAQLICELESSSKFISSDEDRPLTDFCFFEPNTSKAKEIHPSLISAFNGIYKLQRSTMNYHKHISDRSLTMLIPTTGDRWPRLLEYFDGAYQTNGLYERFLYWVIGKRNFVNDVVDLQANLPSLEYMLITRMHIGHRVYEYSQEALAYLTPVLVNMRNNQASPEISTSVPSNKRAEACHRRAADLLERLAAVFQNIFDTAAVLERVKSIDFNRIRKCTFDEIKSNVDLMFYPTDKSNQNIGADQTVSYPDNIDLKELAEVQITSVKSPPSPSMKISLAAATAALRFFDKLLFPQAIRLFNSDLATSSKASMNEFKIVQRRVNIFSLSDLTRHGMFHNHKRDNVNVKQLLSDLEKKLFIKKGRYIKVGCRTIDAWIKQLPNPQNDEQIEQFQRELHNSYNINLSEFIEMYHESVDHSDVTISESAEQMLAIQRSWIVPLKQKLSGMCAACPDGHTGELKSSSATDCVSCDGLSAYDDDSPGMTGSIAHHSVRSTTSFNNHHTVTNVCTSSTNQNDPTDLRVVKTNQCDGVILSILPTDKRVVSDDTQREITTSMETVAEQFSRSPNHHSDQHCALPNELITINDSQDACSILDLLSGMISRIANPPNSLATTYADSITDEHATTATVNEDKPTDIGQTIASECTKSLCRRILLIDSVILSNAKLNQCSKANAIDVRNACQLLIDQNFLSLEGKILANRFNYHEAFLKRIPQSQVEMLDFQLRLANLGILDMETYYESLTKIDTGNNTYLTTHGLSILRNEPYRNMTISIDETSIVEPASSHRQSIILSTEYTDLEGNDRRDVAADTFILSDARQQPSATIRLTKRTHTFAFLEDEHEEQALTSRKKRKDTND